MPKPKQRKLNDLNRSHTPLDVNHTLIVVVELSHASWLVAGLIPGVERQPLKKLEPSEKGLLDLLNHWRKQAEKAGHKIDRITVAFEAGRDGFWLARWLIAQSIEAHVIHASSVAVPRAQVRIVNRIKSTLARLGIRGFNPKPKKAGERLDGLRTPEGEAIPPNTMAELQRDMERRRLILEQIRQIEEARLERLKQAPKAGPNVM